MEEPPPATVPVPTEFGKGLRCCINCKLVKTLQQFLEEGCENCAFLGIEGDRERMFDCTTTNFSGPCAGGWPMPGKLATPNFGPATGQCCLLDEAQGELERKVATPRRKVLTFRLGGLPCADKKTAGCYALQVNAEMPEHIQDILEDAAR
eukprot:scaffold2045_cov404-Prasinococcus_capsulatus_cf.AAC.34